MCQRQCLRERHYALCSVAQLAAWPMYNISQCVVGALSIRQAVMPWTAFWQVINVCESDAGLQTDGWFFTSVLDQLPTLSARAGW